MPGASGGNLSRDNPTNTNYTTNYKLLRITTNYNNQHKTTTNHHNREQITTNYEPRQTKNDYDRLQHNENNKKLQRGQQQLLQQLQQLLQR